MILNPNTLLELHCHVKPPTAASIELTANNCTTVFNLEPTIVWSQSSTPMGSRVLELQVPVGLVDFCITARHSDVIICGYGGCMFNYATQPIWSDGSKFMDIRGHGPDQDLQGPGSLVLPVDVTVTFSASITVYQNGYGAYGLGI